MIKKKQYYVHRLLALAFIDNPRNCPVVDHIDMNTKNNTLSNLRWATKSENAYNCKERKNTSGHRNIYYDKRRSKYYIKTQHIRFLGYYDTIDEALEAKQNIQQ